MTPQNIKEVLIQELPQMLEQDQALRYLILDLVQDKFAPKQETEDKFTQILQEMRRDRAENLRAIEASREENLQAIAALREENLQAIQVAHEENLQAIDALRKENLRAIDASHEKNLQAIQAAHEENLQAIDALREENLQAIQAVRDENLQAIDALREENNRKWAENDRRWEENNRRWEENQRILTEMREDIKQLDRKHDSTIGALGARWGIHSEQSFRSALKSILEESFEVQVLNITEYDDEGMVFGHPDQVEIDIIVKNGLLIIVEIKSSMSKSELYTFSRKVAFYEKHHKQQVTRKIVISPMLDKYVMPVAERLGIEVYTQAEYVDTD